MAEFAVRYGAIARPCGGDCNTPHPAGEAAGGVGQSLSPQLALKLRLAMLAVRKQCGDSRWRQ
jgi:hypothetical protein